MICQLRVTAQSTFLLEGITELHQAEARTWPRFQRCSGRTAQRYYVHGLRYACRRTARHELEQVADHRSAHTAEQDDLLTFQVTATVAASVLEPREPTVGAGRPCQVQALLLIVW